MSHGNKPKGKSGGGSDSKSKKPERVAYADTRFVRIELLENEKEEFRSLLADGEFSSVSIDDFLAEGYSLKFVGSDGGKTTTCTVSMEVTGHHNSGLRLTGRGRDAVTALAVCYYKTHHLCEDGLWREGEARRGGSYDDLG